MRMPESVRGKVIAGGHTILDIGNVRLHLATGKITRVISLDGKPVAEPEFPDHKIDWDIIADALS